MSGFVLLFDQKEPLTAQDPGFVDFLISVTNYKCLPKPGQVASGSRCVAAKFDTPSTLHRGITWDAKTGSWLLAVGTVIDNAALFPNGDLQQLLTDYLKQGAKVFERLDGQFALVIYNGKEDSLAIVSDPFGLISIFYGQKGDQFFVSTSALAVAKGVQSQPSELGVRCFVAQGAVWGEMTLWQEVKRLIPATVLELTRQDVKKFTYWRFSLNDTIANLSLDESVACLIDVLSQTMRRTLAREGKAWLSLTGGFDSRTTAALVSYSGLPFKAYFHGQPDSRDVLLASLISREMGWEHEYFSLPEDWGTQRAEWLSRTLGHCDAHMNILKLSRIVREQTLKAQQLPVSWWGYGGETYRGYYWKQELLKTGATSTVNYDNLLKRFGSATTLVLKDQAKWKGVFDQELKAQLKTVGEQQPDWPNTVKLDLIGQYTEHPLGGATISTVAGLQRAIAPLDFKEGVACVISVNHKWRSHARLVRLMLERINPSLAGIETADGGPALPMRLTNLPRFVPYWSNLAEKLMWGVGYKITGRRLWKKSDKGPDGLIYPEAQWRRDTLAQLEAENLLTPAKMHSSGLYDVERLQTLLAEARKDSFKSEGLLGRILTVEMALREVGTSI
ncbi:MAG: hypothetical protein BroJett011_57530 [Chloroflexota bacterium]|nr:MAG: hypothetical protein BroJett011_57530 [Chloroflexota bacterium]